MNNPMLFRSIFFVFSLLLAAGGTYLYLQRSAAAVGTTGSGAIVHAIQPTVTELGIGNTFNVELGLFTPASNLGRTGAVDMSALGASGTGATVVGSAGSWPPVGVLIADSEAMQYTKIDDTHLNITVRGRFGTAAVQHNTPWLYQVLAVGAANGDSTPNWALVSGNAGSGYPSFVMGGIIPHDNVGFETPGFIIAGPLWTIAASSGRYTQIPPRCVEGEQVFVHDLRANDSQGPGAGTGGYVYCDNTENWKAAWSGLPPAS
jgi:hypothetical protein